MRLLDAALAVQAPQGVDDAIVAALFLKGLTAQALVEEIEPVKPGMFVLAQAPGRGVGQLVARMAKLRGATVIGIAGSPQKVASRGPQVAIM
jgi:NADPH2:quinone reductase